MKYAVISDSHDNFYNLDQAVKRILEEGIKTCFHLGDYCAPGFVKAMTDNTDLRWICVWGNVDGAKAKTLLQLGSRENFDIVDESFREYEVSEGLIFITHFPLLAQNAAASGKYRAAFYGDNHTKHSEVVGDTLLANPGELAGFKSGQPSFGIYDSETNKFQIVDLDDFRVTK